MLDRGAARLLSAGSAASSADLLRSLHDLMRHAEPDQCVHHLQHPDRPEGLQVTVAALQQGAGQELRVASLVDLAAAQDPQRQCTAFISELAHDLRAPLTVIQGYLEQVLDSGEMSAGDRADCLNLVLNEIHHMSALLSSLLESGRYYSHPPELHLQPQDPGELVAHVVDRLRRQADEAGVAVHKRVAEGLPYIHADAHCLIRVFTNLLTNALKYTPEGGTVEVSAVEAGEYLLFTIKDSGPGLTPRQVSVIWEPYYTLDVKPRHALTESAGLGLSIVRRLVALHGGHSGVESAEGQGASFWFTIPLYKPDQPDATGSRQRDDL